MKNVKVLFLVVAMAALVINGNISKASEEKTDGLQGTVTLSGAWALYPMVVKWAEEFKKIHPGVKIDIAAGGAGKGMADCLSKVVDLGMVSRDIYPEEVKKGAWWISVTKDAVVPTINRGNPHISKLMSKGLKKDEFASIWLSENPVNWGALSGDTAADPVSVYTRSDACGAAGTWAKFLGKHQEDLRGVGVYGDPGLAEAVRRDINGIGYNNVNFAYDPKTMKSIDGIAVLPIDVNVNGKIDRDEDFYQTRDQLVKAIADGRYPSPPARDLHLVSNGRPAKPLVVEFLSWILGDGQKYVPESGYIPLAAKKIKDEQGKLGK